MPQVEVFLSTAHQRPLHDKADPGGLFAVMSDIPLDLGVPRLHIDDIPALADLIEAETEAQRRQALRVLEGEVGRRAGDGLPDGSTGASLICYASCVDEPEAVRETVAVLKQAVDLAARRGQVLDLVDDLHVDRHAVVG